MKLAMIIASPAALPVFFAEQTRFLRSNGWEVYALSSPSEELQEFGLLTGSDIVAIPMARRLSPLTDALSLFRIWRTLRKIRPDVVHAHMPKGGLLGMTAARLAGVPVRFFTIHGRVTDTALGWRLRLLRTVERLTCRLATQVLAVSNSLRQSLLLDGACKPSKLEVLGSGGCAGVDTTRFDPDQNCSSRILVRFSYNIPQDAFLLCYAGRLAKEKGITELSAAWQELRNRHPHLRLLLCGPLDPEDPIPQEVFEYLEQDPRVCCWTGIVRDMPGIFAAADLCILPSYREGLGVVALEASAMGKPVVASRTGGLVDAVQDGVTGVLVEPKSAAALVEAIDRLVKDPETCRKLGEAGRAFVHERFEASEISNRLLDAYRLAAHAAQVASSRGKRLFDVLVAILVCVATLPLLLAAMLTVRIRLGSPVLFRQQRGGRNGVPFTLYKLRTMADSYDAAGRLLPDERRLTALGRILRSTSIDELPQLWNVLRGEMSLIGPRPLLASYRTRYSAFENRRHEVLPGLTGWAQVHARDQFSWKKKFELDVWYVDHHSFWIDAQILWLTARRLLWPTDITRAGRPATPEFLGSHNGLNTDS